MIRLPLIVAGGLAAAAAAVTPAIVGLSNNPSFSEQLPVRVPAHASIAKFQPAAPPAVRSRSTAREREPSDDRNLHREPKSKDDRVREADERHRGGEADERHRGGGHRGDDRG